MARQKTTKKEKQPDEIPPGLKLRNTLRGHTDTIGRIAWSPDGRRIASPSSDTTIRIWDLDMDVLLGSEPATESVKYTTAKLVLVGDSGVGKTGLGWRLAHKKFKEHSSTHGQQFWPIGELGITRADGTECEAVLWDLAGQPDYRLVHSLFLDDVDLALVLFDPTNRQEPLGGVNFWLKQLPRRDETLCRAILIGARADRGTATLTAVELETYCRRQRISGGYIATSAKEGDGLPELVAQLKAQIPWDEMTATVTTATFKRIKEYLLTPDLLANLASSFVLEARRNPRGLGVLEENQLLRGQYKFPELIDLTDEVEREALLDATTVLFLEHNICFRETFNERVFLVFPS